MSLDFSQGLKFRVNSLSEFRKLEDFLIKNYDCRWGDGKSPEDHILHNVIALYVRRSKLITYGQDTDYFKDHPNKQANVNEVLLSGKKTKYLFS